MLYECLPSVSGVSKYVSDDFSLQDNLSSSTDPFNLPSWQFTGAQGKMSNLYQRNLTEETLLSTGTPTSIVEMSHELVPIITKTGLDVVEPPPLMTGVYTLPEEPELEENAEENTQMWIINGLVLFCFLNFEFFRGYLGGYKCLGVVVFEETEQNQINSDCDNNVRSTIMNTIKAYRVIRSTNQHFNMFLNHGVKITKLSMFTCFLLHNTYFSVVILCWSLQSVSHSRSSPFV